MKSFGILTPISVTFHLEFFNQFIDLGFFLWLELNATTSQILQRSGLVAGHGDMSFTLHLWNIVECSRRSRQWNHFLSKWTDPSDTQLRRCDILLLRNSFQVFHQHHIVLEVLRVLSVWLITFKFRSDPPQAWTASNVCECRPLERHIVGSSSIQHVRYAYLQCCQCSWLYLSTHPVRGGYDACQTRYSRLSEAIYTHEYASTAMPSSCAVARTTHNVNNLHWMVESDHETFLCFFFPRPGTNLNLDGSYRDHLWSPVSHFIVIEMSEYKPYLPSSEFQLCIPINQYGQWDLHPRIPSGFSWHLRLGHSDQPEQTRTNRSSWFLEVPCLYCLCFASNFQG